MKKSNRVVSFLLALTLVTGLMPADAFTFTAVAAEIVDGSTAAGLTTDEWPVVGGTSGTKGYNQKVTALALSTDTEYTLSKSGSAAFADKTITWSSENANVATVGETTGVVKGVAAGDTRIIATIGEDHYIIPITVYATEKASGIYVDRVFDLYNHHTANCTAYYYYSDEGDTSALKAFPEGMQIYIKHRNGRGFLDGKTDFFAFFGAPKEGYVLTFCAQENTQNAFFSIEDAETELNNYKDKNLFADDLYTAAEGAGAAGAFFNSRTGTNRDGLQASLSFAAESIATIKKELNGVLPHGGKAADFRRYTGARMTAEKDDYVYFTITVTQEAPHYLDEDKKGLLQYSKYSLRDEVQTDGAKETEYFYDQTVDLADGTWDGIMPEGQRTNEKNIAEDLNAPWKQADLDAGYREHQYYVVYQVQDADLAEREDDKLVNKVDYEYMCQSKFSTSSYEDKADVTANLLVVAAYMGEYVLDFGLPIVIEEGGKNYGLKEVNEIMSQYGTVTISDDYKSATYTLNAILPEAEEVLLYRVDGSGKMLINSFTVVPATSVYYEDTVITPGDGWETSGTPADKTQDPDILGNLKDDGTPDKKFPYGYDAVYNTIGASNGTQLVGAEVSVIPEQGAESHAWPTATFTFTGTGVEIYANCSAATGAVMVEIWKADGSEQVRSYLVDTKVSAGDSSATTGQTGEFYGLPIVAVTDLEHGAYLVKLIKVPDPDPDGERFPETNEPRDQGPVYIDGFRVLNTIQETVKPEQSLYFYDQEDYPDFYEMRDLVLSYAGMTEDSYGDKQVYAPISEATQAIITSAAYSVATMQDMMANGPKNELFLWGGQTLTFTVTTKRMMQIGLKAPQGATSVSVSVTHSSGTVEHKVPDSITSSVDMFYDLGYTRIADENAKAVTYTISITNHGDKVLSITKLKICDDPSASFANVTAEDVMIALGLQSQRTYADATVRVALQDYAGNQVGVVTLTKNGAVGRKVAFTAEEILAAAEVQLPEGYAFVNKEAVFDVEATCGESREAYVQVGKVATVKITYISLTSRTVCTITVTKTQFSAGDCRISKTELMHYSPLGRILLSLQDVMAVYGETTEVVVPVL